MTNDNPYTPPAFEVDATQVVGRAPPNELTPPGVWRCDQYLVMHKGAKLPKLCVYSGEPETNRTKLTLMKESGGNSFAFLLGQYGGAAYEMGVKKDNFFVEVPTGESEASRRWMVIGIQAAVVLLGLALLVLTPMLAATAPVKSGGVAAGLICLMIVPVISSLTTRKLSLAHNDLYYVWITGADDKFLAMLETWPYQKPRGVP